MDDEPNNRVSDHHPQARALQSKIEQESIKKLKIALNLKAIRAANSIGF